MGTHRRNVVVRHMKLQTLFLLALAVLPASVWPQAAPALQAIAPNMAAAGSGATTVLLTGSGFTSTSHVVFQGMRLTPTFLNDRTLSVVIPSSQLESEGARLVYVSGGPDSGSSATLHFFVYSPLPPSVTSSIPTGGVRGSSLLVHLGGLNLTGATMSFSGAGITAAPEGSAVRVTISSDAPLGRQAMRLSTPSGSTSVCGSRPCTFSVIEDGSWSEASLPDPLISPGQLVPLLNGRVLMISGTFSDAAPGTPPLPTAYLYDPMVNRWRVTGSTNRNQGGATTILPDGRVLLARGNGPSEIYDPVTEGWNEVSPIGTNQSVRALLLPNGKALVVDALFNANVFDPVAGTSQPAPWPASTDQALDSAMTLLPDGRVLIVRGRQSHIYDPRTESITTGPAMPIGLAADAAVLLPSGKVLVFGHDSFRFSLTYGAAVYDPQTNTISTPSTNTGGNAVLQPDGRVLISSSSPGGGSIALYDPVTDEQFSQTTPSRPGAPTVLLDDGRSFGILSLTTPQVSGTFAQVYTPPLHVNQLPVIGSAVRMNPSQQGGGVTVDIHGSSFLPNSVVLLGQTRLVTLYLGSERLVAFVPPALAASINSGIQVVNPAPGGGASDTVREGYTATRPIPITDVEAGAIRTGYAVVTPAPLMPAPVATLTYGMVRDGIVESQAAILPAGSVTSTSIIVDVVEGIGRNLGMAVANTSATAATVTLTLRDETGAVAATAPVVVPARNQIARFITELFPVGTMGGAFRGSLWVETTVPVYVLGLRFSGPEFSSLPAPSATPGDGGPVVFPQFAMSGGWATTLGLVNPSNIAIAGRIEFFDPGGNRMAVRLNGELQDIFNYSIPPFGSLLLAPRDANGQSPF